jgi:NTE family protein
VEATEEADFRTVGINPDWVAGNSIGAINSALIAGNPPEARMEKLRAFRECVSSRWFANFGT